MTNCQAQAKQFLADCNATMEITFIGKEVPSHWLGETKPHNKYQFTITTPRGICRASPYLYGGANGTIKRNLVREV